MLVGARLFCKGYACCVGYFYDGLDAARYVSLLVTVVSIYVLGFNYHILGFIDVWLQWDT